MALQRTRMGVRARQLSCTRHHAHPQGWPLFTNTSAIDRKCSIVMRYSDGPMQLTGNFHITAGKSIRHQRGHAHLVGMVPVTGSYTPTHRLANHTLSMMFLDVMLAM